VKIPSATGSGLLNLNGKQDSKIVLRAEHAFGNLTTKLVQSDKIWFKGTIKTSLSSQSDDLLACKHDKRIRININSLGCLICADKTLVPITLNPIFNIDNHLRDMRRGFKYLLNVLFYPVVTFK
jgi:wolfamin